MNIAAYRRKVDTLGADRTSMTVLLTAIVVAREMGHLFVDPIHVLIALMERRNSSKLEARLVQLGITSDVLRACADAAQMDRVVRYSFTATAAMFERAIQLATMRGGSGLAVAKVSLGDLAMACVVSSSRPIDVAVDEGLRYSTFEMLVRMNASSALLEEFFPASTVEDIMAIKMSQEAAGVHS